MIVMTDQEVLQRAEEIKKQESQKAKNNNKKKLKGLFMKLIIVFMFCYITHFTYTVLDIFRETGAEPTALVGAVFLFCGWESGCLSKIKVNKDKRKDRDTYV